MSRSYYIRIIVVLFFFITQHSPSGSTKQHDTLVVPNVAAPVIDGNGDDFCWEHTEWQTIDHVWIPYGMPMIDSNNFSGKYKIVWSSKTNLLYFLIEIHDDVFVDGYVPTQTADLYNFDIAEVFIDENASGGLHVFNGKGTVAKEWGTNAQNAFTHHIYAPFPQDGLKSSVFRDEDIAGTGWDNVVIQNHSFHLPEFSLTKNGHTAVWEFSMKVYNDTYSEKNPEASQVQLKANKIMGISVAYCDNDDPQEYPKVRDTMFGSDSEPSPGNLHWKDASYFGRVKLVSESSHK